MRCPVGITINLRCILDACIMSVVGATFGRATTTHALHPLILQRRRAMIGNRTKVAIAFLVSCCVLTALRPASADHLALRACIKRSFHA